MVLVEPIQEKMTQINYYTRARSFSAPRNTSNTKKQTEELTACCIAVVVTWHLSGVKGLYISINYQLFLANTFLRPEINRL